MIRKSNIPKMDTDGEARMDMARHYAEDWKIFSTQLAGVGCLCHFLYKQPKAFTGYTASQSSF
jgi:hypothetical protein